MDGGVLCVAEICRWTRLCCGAVRSAGNKGADF